MGARSAKLESDQGDFAKAVALYQRAAKLSPRNHRIWNSLGSAYKRMGDPARMHEALDNAIRLVESEIQVNPSQAIYYAELAHYRAMKGQAGYGELIAKALAKGAIRTMCCSGAGRWGVWRAAAEALIS